MGCKAKAQGGLGPSLVPGSKPEGSPSEAVPHTTLFLPQEARRTVSMRLNIVSPDMPGELSPGLSGVRG